MSYLLLFSAISHFSQLIVIPARSKLWVFAFQSAQCGAGLPWKKKKRSAAQLFGLVLISFFFIIAWKFEWSLYIMKSMEGFFFLIISKSLQRIYWAQCSHSVYFWQKKKKELGAGQRRDEAYIVCTDKSKALSSNGGLSCSTFAFLSLLCASRYQGDGDNPTTSKIG